MNLRLHLLSSLPRWFRTMALFGCLATLSPLVLADEYTEVNRLLNAGQTSEALARADKYIAANPRDPQMRFVKSQVLQKSGRSSDAESILQQLTQDYPELAEPWNNLAVLHAGRGELEKARAALETAVRQDPKYATALENLGDVQARLASQSYERARQLSSGNRRLGPKIEALDDMLKIGATTSPTPAPETSPARPHRRLGGG
ncbi:tetratricopeptide (TPR) repeat protein [Ottowia thiooxydans]|uniref:Tetratricopeptide (TPR) repeat protein n=2 Tax=Ottowia thiooxydans TaxID=219182 RepID=A0ABV2Q5H1_9BURK